MEGDSFTRWRTFFEKVYLSPPPTSERLLRRLVGHYTEHGMAFDVTLTTLEWAEALVLLGRHRGDRRPPGGVSPHRAVGGPCRHPARWKIVEEAVGRQAGHHEAFRELAMTVRRRWYLKG
jgi:hypothetical protein